MHSHYYLVYVKISILFFLSIYSISLFGQYEKTYWQNRLQQANTEAEKLTCYAAILSFHNNKNTDSLQFYLAKAIPLAQKNLNTRDGIKVLYFKADYFYTISRDSSLPIYEEVANYASKIKYDSLALFSSIKIAFIHHFAGRYLVASKLCYQIYPDVIKSNDTTALMLFYYVLGREHMKMGSYDQALNYCYKHYAIAKKKNDLDNMRAATNTIAGVFFERKDYEKSIYYCKLGINLLKDKNERNATIYYNNISECFIAKSQYDSAFLYTQYAYHVGNAYKSYYNLAFTDRYRGIIYTNRKKYKEGEKLLIKSTQYFKDGKYDDDYAISLVALADLYKAAGQYKLSDSCFREATAVKDEVTSRTTRQRVAEMDIVYGTQEKQKKIELKETENRLQQQIIRNEKRQKYIYLALATLLIILSGIIYLNYRRSLKLNRLLHLKNVTIERQAAELKQSNEVKNKLFTIISHDLRSPVNSYQGLADIISYLLKKGDYDKIEAVAEKIDETGKHLSVMLNSLLVWSISEQNLLDYKSLPVSVKSVAEPVLAVYNSVASQSGIHLVYEDKNEAIIETDKSMLAMIIRNIVDNAIKHSPSGSEVLMQVLNTSNSVLLRFKNPASSIPAGVFETMKSLFNGENDIKPGEKGIGIGLYLVNQCLKQMNKKMDLSTDGKDLIFELRFEK